MRKIKHITLLCSTLFFFSFAHAQLDAIRLSFKGYTGIGIGAFINIGYPVNQADMITNEGSFGCFNHIVTAVPLCLGYRHTFNGKGTGTYVEPQVGYTFVASDFPGADSSKSGAGTSNSAPSPGGGLATGLAFGYIFPGRLALNLGVKYEHIFAGGNPSIDMLSFRITHTIVCGRKKYHYS